MPSIQPTHHGYAVNVKDHGVYDRAGDLPDHEAEAIYGMEQEDFWREAEALAHEHGFRTVYAEGHMGGWCVPQPQPSLYLDDELWVEEHFRPFEEDVLALLEDVRDRVAEAFREAARIHAAEPAEAAYWAARDVVTT
jgi:hypothetical protein